jgi:hypothetical protein
MKRYFQLTAACFFLVACTKAKVSEPSPITAIHYQADIQPIITMYCIGCHDANTSFPMDSYVSVSALAQSGQLKGALLSDNGPDAIYLHMPPFDTLDVATIQKVINWVDEGHPE